MQNDNVWIDTETLCQRFHRMLTHSSFNRIDATFSSFWSVGLLTLNTTTVTLKTRCLELSGGIF